MNGPRFKIDSYDSSSFPFVLLVRRPNWLGIGSYWSQIDIFETRDKAKARYELVKDLPEYLD